MRVELLIVIFTARGERRSRADRLHAPSERRAMTRLDQQVDVIALEGGVHQPARRPRAARGERALDLPHHPPRAERRDAGTQPHRCVREDRGEAGPAPIRCARIRGGLSSRAFASFAPPWAVTEGDLSGEDVVALCLDGKTFADAMMVLALGITMAGEKRVLGFVETDTENAKVLPLFLRSLVDRGLDASQGLLVVLDGGKGLRAAVQQVCRARAVVHRCQWHKREHVVSDLANHEQGAWRRRLQRAYHRPVYHEARAALQALHAELEDRNQSAAGSLAEGLDETLTLHCRGVDAVLGRSFKTTNGLESVKALVEERGAKVDHGQHSRQRQRWLATALAEIEPRLRTVIGDRHLPKLREALQRALKINTKTSKGKAASPIRSRGEFPLRMGLTRETALWSSRSYQMQADDARVVLRREEVCMAARMIRWCRAYGMRVAMASSLLAVVACTDPGAVSGPDGSRDRGVAAEVAVGAATRAGHASAGMEVSIDPETGAFTAPPSATAHALAETAATGVRAVAPLAEVPGPSGGTMIELRGRFESTLAVARQPDGTTATRCTQATPAPGCTE